MACDHASTDVKTAMMRSTPALDSGDPAAATPSSAAVASHVPALDGIRGIAILWVLSHNVMDVLSAPTTGPLHLVALLTHPGWIGVQIFFVLSGFLITGNLLDSQSAKNYFASFYARRILRIFPLYYAVLALTLLILPRFLGEPSLLQPAVDHQIWLWLFLGNMAPGSMYGFSHFWSLAVEEQFYIVWPFLVHRLPVRRVMATCVAIACAVLLIRSGLAFAKVSADWLYTSTLCRMDALSLGAAGAAFLRIPNCAAWLTRHLRFVGLGAAALFGAGVVFTRAYDTSGLACQTVGYTILALTSAVLVTGAAVSTGVKRPWLVVILQSAVLRALGKYSFAIYVFHVLLHKLIGEPWLHAQYGDRIPGGIVLAYGLSVLLVSFALAYASYHGFEKHFLRLKRRFVPEPAVGSVTTS